MDRISLTSSSDIPVNSPVLKMREIEFRLAAMHRENDELRVQLEQREQMINKLLEEKSNFEAEQEEAERRYMELEDKFLELEKMVRDRRGVISSPYVPSVSVASSSSSSSVASATTTIAASSSPPPPMMNGNHNLDSSQSIGRSSLASSSNQLGRSYGTASPSINTSQAIMSPSSLAASSNLASSSSVVPNLTPNPSASSKAVNKPPPSPSLTSCVIGDHNSHLDISVVPSPTPAKKHRKKSIISLFSL